MGALAVTVYQPVAGLLGKPTPGGWRFDVSIDGEALLETALTEAGHGELATSLASARMAVYYVVVVNGRADPARLLARVREGDEVSILPVYVGG